MFFRHAGQKYDTAEMKIFPLSRDGQGLLAVCVSPDRRCILAMTADGAGGVRVLPIPPAEARLLAEKYHLPVLLATIDHPA